MHKAPKCIQSLWDLPKKIPFVQKYKESAICAILREETPFCGIPRGKKGVVICAICLRKAAHWPNNNANPSGLSEKKVYCVEVCNFVDKVEISVLRGVGWVPQKSAGFGATAPAQKHPRSRCGTKKHSIWHYFYRIWRY